MFLRAGVLRSSLFLICCLLSVGNKVEFAEAGQEPTGPSIEYQIKASLIFNFIQFIEWPNLEAAPASTFRICVFGKDQFGSALSYFEKETVFDRRVQKVVLSSPSEELKTCQVLYIPRGAENEEVPTLTSLNEAGVLTIGESEDFLEKGGIIRLARADQKIIFDINRRASLESHFKITSKLLRLARQVVD